MKKTISLVLIVLLLFSPITAFAGVNININGSPLSFTESSGTPFVDSSNRTQVPLRIAMESYGCKVSWNQDTQTAIVEKDGVKVEVPIGVNYIIKDGVKITNDTAALIKDNRTYLPIRAVLEAFGANVSWDQTTQTVIVSASDGTQLMTICFMDVGQGDSILIDFGAYECLVDAGTASAGKVVSNYLKNRVDGNLELIIATHAHADHIGGLAQIINDFNVEKVIDSGSSATSQSWKSYYESAINEVGANFLPDTDMTIDMGNGASLQIIEGLDGDGNENNNSVATIVTYKDISVLLSGDNETAGETAILSKVPDVNVFKAGHHGSNTANTAALLAKAKPEYVIVSAGAGNTYKHPHSEALQRFSNAGATVYGTFKSGTIVMSTDGSTYSFDTTNAVTMDDAGDKAEITTETTPVATPTVTNTTTSTTQAEAAYVGNMSSKKVHLLSCRYAGQIFEGNRIYFKSLAEAEGYTPCKVCCPQ